MIGNRNQSLWLAAAVLLLFLPAACVEPSSAKTPEPKPLLAAPDGTMAPAPPEPARAQPAGPPRLVIAGAGDIMAQRRCNRSVRQKSKGAENNYGYDGWFQDISPALADADLAVANLEFPVFDRDMPEQAYVFYGREHVFPAVKKAGFNLLTTANNHAYDHGRTGPESTSRLCREKGMRCVGTGPDQAAAEAPFLLEKNGMKIAVIGYTLLTNANLNTADPAKPRVNGYRFDELVRQVKAARALADGVVVTVHWGQEYRLNRTPTQVKQARELFEAGASLILGHHPHVLEEVELMEASDGRKCLVAYSLSNFTSNQNGGSPTAVTRLGAILKAVLIKTEKGVEVESWSTLPTWIFNANVKLDGKTIEDVHVEVAPLEIERLRAHLERQADEQERNALLRKIDFHEGRIAHAEKIMKQPAGAIPRGEPASSP